MTQNGKIILGTVVAVIIAVVVTVALVTPEDRSIGERIESAAGRLDEGVDDAARELENRSPAERIEDGYNDATDGNPG